MAGHDAVRSATARVVAVTARGVRTETCAPGPQSSGNQANRGRSPSSSLTNPGRARPGSPSRRPACATPMSICGPGTAQGGSPSSADTRAPGVIEAVGPDVTRVAVGDHVVCSFIPACGVCRYCSTGHQNLCDWGAQMMTGMLADGTFRFHDDDGADLGGFCMLGTFAERAVVSQNSCVRIDADIPFEVAALVGCGVPTGWGTSVYAAARGRRRYRGDLRRGRRGQQRRPGGALRRGGERGRGGSGRVQADEGAGVRGDARVRLRGRGTAGRHRDDPRAVGRSRHRHGRRAERRGGQPGRRRSSARAAR